MHAVTPLQTLLDNFLLYFFFSKDKVARCRDWWSQSFQFHGNKLSECNSTFQRGQKMYKGVEWKNQSSLFNSASSEVLCSVLKIVLMLDIRDRAHPFIISKGACNISVAGCFSYIVPTLVVVKFYLPLVSLFQLSWYWTPFTFVCDSLQ